MTGITIRKLVYSEEREDRGVTDKGSGGIQFLLKHRQKQTKRMVNQSANK